MIEATIAGRYKRLRGVGAVVVIGDVPSAVIEAVASMRTSGTKLVLVGDDAIANGAKVSGDVYLVKGVSPATAAAQASREMAHSAAFVLAYVAPFAAPGEAASSLSRVVSPMLASNGVAAFMQRRPDASGIETLLAVADSEVVGTIPPWFVYYAITKTSAPSCNCRSKR